jgi:hypothetical protein
MKYLLAIRGTGEGCDYTIGCNQKILTIEAENLEDALVQAEEYYIQRGGPEYIESISICDILAELDVERVWAERLREEEELEEEDLRAQELAELNRLKAKYERP